MIFSIFGERVTMNISKSLSRFTRSHSRRISVCSSDMRSSSSSARASALSAYRCIPSLHPVVGASDGRGHQDQNKLKSDDPDGDVFRAPAATVAARKPASARVLPSSLRAGWHRIKAASDWLDNHWLGDLLGAICVFGFGFVVLLISWGLQP